MSNKKSADTVKASVAAEGQNPQKKTPKTTIPLNDEYIKEIFDENDRIDAAEREELKKKAYSPMFLESYSMDDLLGRYFGNRPYIIDTLMNPGVYLLVGAPKMGKSFLSLQIAHHVSTGNALWDCTVRKGTVLYLSLEDTLERLQRRTYQMFFSQNPDQENKNLRISTTARTVDNGLFEQLLGFVKENPDTALIIIDTLQKVRESEAETYSYSSDYALITRFMEFAKDHNLAIILVHHTRKQSDADPFNTVSGTNGLTGAVDGTMLLTKAKRTDDCAILEITGRDIQDQKLQLKRNELTLAWELEMRETDLWKEQPDPTLEKVAAFVKRRKDKKWAGTATQLCRAIKQDIKPNALSYKLNANVTRLFKDFGIQYQNKRTNTTRYIILTVVSSEDP